MAMATHMRFAAGTLLGIALIAALGYWITQNWSEQKMIDLLTGTGPDQPGLLARQPNEFRETARRQHFHALIADPAALDSRRVVKLIADMRLADFLRPGEVLPPPHLARLFIEARAPEVLKQRCADWQAVLATRCMLLNATVENAIHPYNGGEAVKVTATYAVSPKTLDPVAGDPAQLELRHLPIRFEINPNRVNAETRRAMLARAYDSYLAACADLRSTVGNCNFIGFEFREGRLGEGYFNLSGSGVIGGLAAPGGKS